MKKRKLILTGAVLLSLMMAGCKAEEKPEETPPAETPEEVQEEEAKAPGVFVSEAVSETGIYKDESGAEVSYSYKVPFMEDETDDAAAINEQLEIHFGRTARRNLELMEEGKPITCSEIRWNCYETEGMAALVVEADYEEEPSEHAVYLYDREKGKQVSNDAYLEKLGVTEEEFTEKAACASVAAFDERYQEMPRDEYYQEMYYGRIFPLRQSEMSDVKFDETGLFVAADDITKEEKLWFYEPEGTELLSFTLGEEKQYPEQTVTEGFITATLRENRVFVSFEETDEAKAYLFGSQYTAPGQETLEFGKEYEIGGLHSEYKKIMLSPEQEAFTPALFLLTDNGQVEMADVIFGASFGVQTSIPAPGLGNVIDLRVQDVNNVEKALFAVTDSGEKTELAPILASSKQAVPDAFTGEAILESEPISHPVASGVTYSSVYEISFKEGGEMVMTEHLPDVETELRYEGLWTCLGADDDGLVFSFLLYNDESVDPSLGTMRISFHAFEEEDELKAEDVEIQILSGTQLFDRPDEAVSFTVR